MASRGNVTGIHIALVFFLMLSCILGVVSWQQTKSATANADASKQAQKDLKALDVKWNDAQDQLDSIKRKLGYTNLQVVVDGSKSNQLPFEADEYLKKVGIMTETSGTSFKEVLEKLVEKLTTSDGTLKDTVALHNLEKTKRADQEQQLQTQIDDGKDRLKASEAALAKAIASIRESLKPLEDEIANLNGKNQTLQSNIDQLTTAYNLEKGRLMKELLTLRTTVGRQTQIIADRDQLSFEIPDGEIMTVNYQLGLVWINLGSADNLPLLGTFSVYGKSNNGIGRGKKIDPNNPESNTRWRSGPKDIKGAIEITRILGPHRAEARILLGDGDDENPFSEGDLIYSPSYTPGRINSFAFVGDFDIDNDGKQDTEALKAAVLRNRGRISSFVDESITHASVKSRVPVSAQDKFLVLGTMPDLTKSLVSKKDAHRLMAQEYGKMIQEARDNGVRIIRMNEFLAYMGIKPTQRLYRKGEDSIFTLKSGSKSSGIGAKGDRTASGKVTDLYTNRHKRLKGNRQQSSNGAVSGLYKGGGK